MSARTNTIQKNISNPIAAFCGTFDFSGVGINTQDLLWYDRQGVMRLDGPDGRRCVTLTITDPNMVGTFEGFTVAIVHHDTGTVVAKYFAFRDYMPSKGGNPKVVAGAGWQWYGGSAPDREDIARYGVAVRSWIGQWV